MAAHGLFNVIALQFVIPRLARMTSSYFKLRAFLGKFEGFCSPGSGLEMDHEIWLAMPKDILTYILLRLPPRAFVRFRAVSKDFEGLLTSPSFLEKHAGLQQAPATGMALCGIRLYHSSTSESGDQPPEAPRDPNLSCQSRSAKKSLKVDLGFLPEEYRDLRGFENFAADDGLVCVWKYRLCPSIGQKAWSFCVFNPVTRRFVCLPAHGFYRADGTLLDMTRFRDGEAPYPILKVCMCVTKADYGRSLKFPSQFLVMVLCLPSIKESSPAFKLASLYSSLTGTWNCGWIADQIVKLESNLPQYLLSSTRFLAPYYVEHLLAIEYPIDGEGRMFNDHAGDKNVEADMERLLKFENPGSYAASNPRLVEYGEHIYSVDSDPGEDWDVKVIQLKNPAPKSSLEPGSCDFRETVSIAPSSYVTKGISDLKHNHQFDPKTHSLSVDDALVAGDAIFIILRLAMSNERGRVLATRILEYNILQGTFDVKEKVRRSSIRKHRLFVPRF